MNRSAPAGFPWGTYRNLLLTVAGTFALGVLATSGWAMNPEPTPLPPVETIVARAWQRAQTEPANDQAFKTTYGYIRNKTTEYRNIRGNLTERKTKTSVNEPAPRPTGDLAEAAAESAWTTNAVSPDTSKHKRDLLSTTNLAARYTFELQGREIIEGRPAFVVAFQPVGGKLPAPTLKDRFLNKAAGRVWVDEEEFALVKVDVHLTDSVSVVGGLVGKVHKFKLSFGRERTEDGLWYTRLLTWHLELREVIVERVIDCVETKTEVRKGR